MEKQHRKYIVRLRQTLAVAIHRLRYAWDEFRGHFAPSHREQVTTFEDGAALDRVPAVLVPPREEESRAIPLWLPRLGLFGLLFLVGVGLGYQLKILAQDHVTIGHGDYRLLPQERLYALNTLREQALQNGASLAVETKPVYPTCALDDMRLPKETAL